MCRSVHQTLIPDLRTDVKITENGNSYEYTYNVDFAYTDDGRISWNEKLRANLSAFQAGTLSNGGLALINFLADFNKQFEGLLGGQDANEDEFWAVFLLHELGHLIGGLPTDARNDELSVSNTKAVLSNCLKGIRR